MPTGRNAIERTFVIADVRDYTRFTHQHGDSAAAELASKFARLAREAVEARGGHVIELRGDEALAVFDSPIQALTASVEFLATCAEEVAVDPSVPLHVGIGVAVGEAVPVEGGYRGAALNLAARLCSQAAAGEVLITRPMAVEVEDGFRLDPRGSAALKGFDETIELVAVTTDAPIVPLEPAATESVLPLELEADSPLVGRAGELRWLRGTWRQIRRGRGRMLFVSGQEQIGKTRLVAEFASEVNVAGASVRYVAPGPTAAAEAITALADVADIARPTLLIVDDLDVAGERVAEAMAAAFERVRRAPLLVIGLVQDATTNRSLTTVVDRADERGDGHRVLAPLDPEEVRAIAEFYLGPAVADAPLEQLARSSGGIPGKVHEVVGEWAQEEGTRRLAAAAEWLAERRAQRRSDLEFTNNVIGLRLNRRLAELETSSTDVCPYKGLAAFNSEDSVNFFGRELLVGDISARTVGIGLLGVVGASGSGKSSVMAAGVLPSLRAGLLPGSQHWRAVVMRPGAEPSRSLAVALTNADLGPNLAEAIREQSPEDRLVLVVDQFEEIFTICSSETERISFVETLCDAATASPHAIVVIPVIRGDFYGHCGEHREFADLLESNHVLVGPMSEKELRRAIELPARRSRVRIESALVDALVEEILGQVGALPLLSTALVELWQQREDGWIRMHDYAASGGVRAAVARMAEASYEQLEPKEQIAARAIFLRLVGPGDGEAVTQRRVPIGEFDLIASSPTAKVLSTLTRDRLLTTDGSTVELVHEALLREWPRLGAWLAEDAEGRQLRYHLTQATRRWNESGRDASELYRGARLNGTLDWAAEHSSELNDSERAFLSASRNEAETDAARQRRANRRLRGLLGAVATFLIASLIAGVIALVQQQKASDNALTAVSQRLGAQALVEEQPDLALLLAAAGHRLEDSPETRGTLLARLLRMPAAEQVIPSPSGNRLQSIAISPDGKTLAFGDNNGEVALVDVDAREPLDISMKMPPSAVVDIGWTSDGELIAAAGLHAARVWDTTSGELVSKLEGLGTDWFLGNFVIPAGSERLIGLSSPPEEGPTRGRVMVWNMRTGRLMGKVVDVPTDGGAFSPDGRLLFVGAGEQAGTELWNVTKGTQMRSYDTPPAFSIAIDANGRMGAVGAPNGTVALVDLRSGAVQFGAGSHSATVQKVAFTPRGDLLISAGDDERAIAWEAATGDVVETYDGHSGRVHAIAFGADGEILYTGGLDANVLAWDLSGRTRLGKFVPAADEDSGLATVGMSSDGRLMAVSATQEGDIQLWDTSDMSAVGDPLRGGGSAWEILFQPGDDQIFVSSEAGVTTYDLRTDDRRGTTLELPDQATDEHAGAMATTPDGDALVISTGREGPAPGRVLVYDFASEEFTTEIELADDALDVAVSPDGTMVGVGLYGGKFFTYSMEDGSELAEVAGERGGYGFTLDFTSDSASIVTGSDSGFVRTYDAASGEPVGRDFLAHAGFVLWLDVSPDGGSLVTSGSDGKVALWDMASRDIIGAPLPAHDNEWTSARFSPDGDRVAVHSSGGAAYLWDVTADAWHDRACAIAGRDLTDTEWTKFIPDRDQISVCL